MKSLLGKFWACSVHPAYVGESRATCSIRGGGGGGHRWSVCTGSLLSSVDFHHSCVARATIKLRMRVFERRAWTTFAVVPCRQMFCVLCPVFVFRDRFAYVSVSTFVVFFFPRSFVQTLCVLVTCCCFEHVVAFMPLLKSTRGSEMLGLLAHR